MKTMRILLSALVAVVAADKLSAQDPLAPGAPPAAAPQTEMQKWIATTDAQWQEAFKKGVSDVHETDLNKVKLQYLTLLEEGIVKASKASDLTGAVALRDEQKRFGDTQLLPETDEAAVPASVKQIRATIRAQIAKMNGERAARAKALHGKYDQLLAQAQAQLTQAQRLDDALLVKAKREEVSAAWLTPGVAPVVPAPTPSVPPAVASIPKPATPVPNVSKPAVPAAPSGNSEVPSTALAAGAAGVIEVAAEMKPKSAVSSPAEGAIVFEGPGGNGRRYTKGVLLINDPQTGKSGTTWSFKYSRSGGSQGLHIIHPHGNGQMIAHVHKDGVGISTPASWAEAGWGKGDQKRMTKHRGLDEIFPLNDGEDYQVVSKLDGQGGYGLTINGKLVATAHVTKTSPLSLEIKPGTNAPGLQRWGTPEFKGEKLPMTWAAGSAAVILGPMEGAEKNVCWEIRFLPAVLK